MLALLAIVFASFGVALSGAMMPGPVLTVTIDESSRRGVWAGPLLIVGHAALELVLLVALLVGLGPFLGRPDVFRVVALVGAAILLWMAAGIFRSLPGLRLDLHPKPAGQRRLILKGALTSVANPYWGLWWATAGLACVAKWGDAGWTAVTAFFVGHILGDFAWYTAVSVAVAKGRRFLTDRLYRGLLGLCACFLVGLGLYFGHASVKAFF